MEVTRIFTGRDGLTHFQQVDIPISDSGPIGRSGTVRRAAFAPATCCSSKTR